MIRVRFAGFVYFLFRTGVHKVASDHFSIVELTAPSRGLISPIGTVLVGVGFINQISNAPLERSVQVAIVYSAKDGSIGPGQFGFDVVHVAIRMIGSIYSEYRIKTISQQISKHLERGL